MTKFAVLFVLLFLGACSAKFDVNCSDDEAEQLVQQIARSRIQMNIIWANIVRPEEVTISLEDTTTKAVFERSRVCEAKLIYRVTPKALVRNPGLVNLGYIANTVIQYQLDRTDAGKLQATIYGFRL